MAPCQRKAKGKRRLSQALAQNLYTAGGRMSKHQATAAATQLSRSEVVVAATRDLLENLIKSGVDNKDYLLPSDGDVNSHILRIHAEMNAACNMSDYAGTCQHRDDREGICSSL